LRQERVEEKGSGGDALPPFSIKLMIQLKLILHSSISLLLLEKTSHRNWIEVFLRSLSVETSFFPPDITNV
jgi:hypothetical protein